MRQVWRFAFGEEAAHDGGKKIVVPKRHKVLHVDTKYETPCVWIEVDLFDERRVERTLQFFGTGQDIPDEFSEFLGTFTLAGGALWFHAYFSSHSRLLTSLSTEGANWSEGDDNMETITG